MPELEHDRELIERLALVHEANATDHVQRAVEARTAAAAPRGGWSQHEMLAASGFALAASYWSLIAPRIAVQRYRRAAEMYRALGHTYWMVLALLSGSETEMVQIFASIDEPPAPPGAQAVAFAMVGNELAGEDRNGWRRERLDTHWRHLGNLPVARLGIPLDHYARVAGAIRVARAERDMDRFFAETGAYVRRAAEVLHSASHDQFHWQRLLSTALPAEPEAVAMTRAMSMVSHELFETPLSAMGELDAHGRRLVEIGDEMWDAARGESEGLRAR